MAISLDANMAVQQTQQRISSGKQINSAKDDAAGSAISTRIDAAVNGKTQAIKNAGDGASLLQTASGTLSSVTDGLQRLRELTMQSGNGIYSESDKALLEKEKQQLLSGINESLKSASFNGQSLFSESKSLDLQVGDQAGQTLAVALPDLSDLSNNLNSLDDIDAAISTVTEQAVNFGAAQNRLDATVERLSQSSLDAQQARSRIEDADLAKEISELTANNVRDQIDIAMQAQANQDQGKVLQLLNLA
ncbi:flagellin [Salinibius halmophilus]|uniref:flagellin n=1 Tax=Salinibius halmophilus TaxID=1853216 RepID=UPI000E66AB63|nr:flagellin [Salinibius halmophilus]